MSSGLIGAAEPCGWPLRTNSPGTESAGPEASPVPPAALLGFGPAENFASRGVSGKGPGSLVAGFSPTTATLTFADGNAATSSAGASSIGGTAGTPLAFPSWDAIFGAGGG